MLVEIDPYYPEWSLVQDVVGHLRNGGVAILPTDTVYALVCDIESRKGLQELKRLAGKGRNKLYSIILSDLADIGTYASDVSTFGYRTLKRLLPGPYTFILPAADIIPKLMRTRRRTIGVRIPDNPITQEVAAQLGRPLVATTLGIDEDPFLSDPYALHDEFGPKGALVIDGGVITSDPSSVVDLSERVPAVLRAGKGDVSLFGG